jgi:YD repeat-containing protein
MEFEYDDNGMLIEFTKGEKSELYRYVKRDYGGFSRYSLTSTTDGRGYTTTYDYLPQARIPGYISSTEPFNSTKEVVNRVHYPDGSVGVIDYPKNNREERLIYDLMGNVTEYQINRYGNPVRMLEPEGTLTEMDWSDGSDAVDLVMIGRHVLPGAPVIYHHDSQGNVIHEQEEGAEPTITEWNLDFNKVIKRIFPGGGSYTAKLDDNGNEIVKLWSDGTKHTIKYNDRGQKTEIKINNGVTINYHYDRNGYISKEIHSSEGITDYVHDEMGRLLSKRVEGGAETILRYDDLGRKIYEKNDEGEFHYEYDSEDNLITEENVGKRLINYYYDERERVIKYTINNKYTFSYTYDKNSNILTKTDPDGVVRNFRYNAEDVRLMDPIEVKQAGLPVQRGR